MAVTWFVCPYDYNKDISFSMRECAVTRYLPINTNDSGDMWSCMEILGGFALVKISASATTLGKLRGDTDFTELPPIATVSIGTKTKLQALGYSSGDVAATTMAGLRNSIASSRSSVLSATGGKITLGSSIPAARILAEIDTDVPG